MNLSFYDESGDVPKTIDELSKLPINSLRKIASRKSICTTGKKSDLAERIFACQEEAEAGNGTSPISPNPTTGDIWREVMSPRSPMRSTMPFSHAAQSSTLAQSENVVATLFGGPEDAGEEENVSFAFERSCGGAVETISRSQDPAREVEQAETGEDNGSEVCAESGLLVSSSPESLPLSQLDDEENSGPYLLSLTPVPTCLSPYHSVSVASEDERLYTVEINTPHPDDHVGSCTSTEPGTRVDLNPTDPSPCNGPAPSPNLSPRTSVSTDDSLSIACLRRKLETLMLRAATASTAGDLQGLAMALGVDEKLRLVKSVATGPVSASLASKSAASSYVRDVKAQHPAITQSPKPIAHISPRVQSTTSPALSTPLRAAPASATSAVAAKPSSARKAHIPPASLIPSRPSAAKNKSTPSGSNATTTSVASAGMTVPAVVSGARAVSVKPVPLFQPAAGPTPTPDGSAKKYRAPISSRTPSAVKTVPSRSASAGRTSSHASSSSGNTTPGPNRSHTPNRTPARVPTTTPSRAVAPAVSSSASRKALIDASRARTVKGTGCMPSSKTASNSASSASVSTGTGTGSNPAAMSSDARRALIEASRSARGRPATATVSSTAAGTTRVTGRGSAQSGSAPATPGRATVAASAASSKITKSAVGTTIATGRGVMPPPMGQTQGRTPLPPASPAHTPISYPVSAAITGNASAATNPFAMLI